MKNGVCSKCGGEQIYHSYGERNKVQEGGLHTGEGLLSIYINEAKGFLGTHTSLYLDCYLCKDCGYFESYVHDLQELDRLDRSTNWRPVQRP
jgi:hypothetical protein